MKISPEVVTLAQSVTDILRAEIVSGFLVPGEKLQEVSLSERLGVSRTPLRAGLHSLASEGLVQYQPNRGYSVRTLDPDRLIAIFDLRGVLEGLAARLAAENGMSQMDEAVFRDALVRGDTIMAQGVLRASDREPFGEINVQIHQIILKAADNVLLEDMLLRCRNTPISSARNVLWHDFAWVRRSHDDHYRLLDAILLRDGPRAEQLMKEHVHAVKLQIKAELESGVNSYAL